MINKEEEVVSEVEWEEERKEGERMEVKVQRHKGSQEEGERGLRYIQEEREQEDKYFQMGFLLSQHLQPPSDQLSDARVPWLKLCVCAGDINYTVHFCRHWQMGILPFPLPNSTDLNEPAPDMRELVFHSFHLRRCRSCAVEWEEEGLDIQVLLVAAAHL